MAASSSFIPTPLAHADNRPTKFNLYNPEVRGANGFSVLPEVYFSGSENVTDFLEGIDNQIRLLEIPSDLSCAYLKGHLLGRAQDWYQIFGSTRGSRNGDNVERRGWNVRRMSNADDSQRNWRNSEILRRPSNGRNDYSGNYENGRQGNRWFDSKNRIQKDDRRFNDRGYQF
ncbi:uncharacterized protein TNCV_2295411 [Trichonephila clavipes]|nr:uncharacterized protein TNCV_2295411 [Trichonephila clavipes]